MSVSGSVYGTTEYIYDINAGLPLLLVEKDNSGNQSNYIYAGRLLSRIVPEGELFYHQDGLGSISVISDVYGNPLNRYTYDVFGNLLSSNESVNDIFGFTGEPRDPSGLIFLRARYYDPVTGRFINRDTYRGNIYEPWIQNLYAYCNNNPVNFVDPTGHWEEDVHYNLTYNIAINLGLSENEAGIIAWYDNNVDYDSETDPKTGDQGWHFNRSIRNGDDPNVVDTRKTHADEMLDTAKEILNNPQTREQGLAALGQGLHALQDMDGHLELGAQNDGRIYTPHDQGWVNYSLWNDHTDDTNYDYIDGNFVNTGQVNKGVTGDGSLTQHSWRGIVVSKSKGMRRMPRVSRELSKTGIYHIMLRGNERRKIFYG